MAQKLDTIHNVANDAKAGIDEMHLLKRREKIDAWLSPADPSVNQQRAREGRQSGSGEWFLQDTLFSAWRTEPASFLWLNGIPGCGKTVLISAIIDHLQQVEADQGTSQTLLYFYFDFTDSHKQSLYEAIQSLISQLYYKQPRSQKHLDMLWSSCQEGKQQPSTGALSSTLEKMLQDAREVCIVLDALDECESRNRAVALGLRSWLKSLRRENIHLLVTSRPEDDIRSAIESLAVEDEIIRLESNLISGDIYSFIHEQVTQGSDFRRWRDRLEIQQEIESTLREKSNGMYDYRSRVLK